MPFVLPNLRCRRPSAHLAPALCLAVAAGAVLAAGGDEPAAMPPPRTASDDAPPPKLEQAIGLALRWQPVQTGDPAARWALQPTYALRYGRWRVGSSRYGALFTATDSGAGAHAVLVDTPNWRAGLGLRLDNGQSSTATADGIVSRELPRSVRLRGYANWRPESPWSAGASLSQDIAHRQGGLVGAVDLGRALPEWVGERWGASIGFTWGDARWLGGHYGTLASSVPVPRAAYEPGAGLVDVHAGVGTTWSLGPRWMAWAQGGAARLVGPAAASPLNRRLVSAEAQLGIAWRLD